MIKRKGQLLNDVNFKIILTVIAIALIGYGVYNLYGKPIAIAKLIPGLNYTEPTDGMSIVGINLARGDNRLEYFTGEKWKTVDMKADKFVLGNYEFNPEAMKQELTGFYFSTPREPSIYMKEINSWRYIESTISPDSGKVLVKFKTKNGFYGDKYEVYYNIGFDDQIKQIGATDYSLGELYSPSFSSFELNKDPSIRTNLIEWRDSILQNSLCEKFLSFSNLKENKEQNNKKYVVRKLNNYLFVDLRLDSNDKTERYGKGCFSQEKFETSVSTIKKPLNIYFVDSFLGRTLYFNFDPTKGWTVSPNTKYVEGSLWWKEEKDRYVLETSSPLYGNIKYSLISGIYNIFNTAAGYVFANSRDQRPSVSFYFGTAQNSETVYEMNGITKQDISKFDEILYSILDKYNSKIVVETTNA